MKKCTVFSIGCLLLGLLIFPQCGRRQVTPLGLFVSVLQEPTVLSNREAISQLIKFAKKTHTRVLFVQIYRAGKAWFPSKIADPAPYQSCLKSVGEDPFALLIKKAHASGIQVHAWLNLLSLSQNTGAPILKKYGPEILTVKPDKKKKLEDYRIDNQYFLEPGDLRVRKELCDMVREILRAYPALDGVQFDYIRYPDKNPFYGYTKMNMDRFKKATGESKLSENNKTWKNWRRDQVTGFLQELVQQSRQVRPNIQVSATGCMPYVRAYHEAFQDWPFWLKSNLVDFVTVMSYTGEVSAFENYVSDTRNRVSDFKKVMIAVGAYKLVRQPEIFAREYQLCEESRAGACVVLHYGNLIENPPLAAPLMGGGVGQKVRAEKKQNVDRRIK